MIQMKQQRLINSKKKCNLFVKNFPSNYIEEDLRNLFSKHGEIKGVKIIPNLDGQASTRAFVCFKQPGMAELARSYLHGLKFETKKLYVTYYDLPPFKKKIEAKEIDKSDFYIQRMKPFAHQL
jgi:RNA recognition motif-containing protein